MIIIKQKNTIPLNLKEDALTAKFHAILDTVVFTLGSGEFQHG